MVTALAAVSAATAAGLWRRRSAAARLRAQTDPELAALVLRLRSRLTRRSRLARREREVVALIRALAAELRGGAPAPVAFAAAASAGTGEELASVLMPAVAAVARGAPLAEELGRAGASPGGGRLLPVAAAWTVAARHGSSMTGVLDRLADAYDDEDAVRADLATSVAGARASMLLLGCLPLAGLALGGALGAHPWTWLLGGPPGWAVCLAAAMLDATGVAWTRWLLRARP